MKTLALVGEGHGETTALPVLVRKLLKEKAASPTVAVENNVIRARDASTLVVWDKSKRCPNFEKWIKYVQLASHRQKRGGVLAIFDGDARCFPAGGPEPFCAARAAKALATSAREVGAGTVFSLAVVFAVVEYESWLIAGADSLGGKMLADGRPALPAGVTFPSGDPESHGKGWLERNCPGYRPPRDQTELTEMVDLSSIRAKKLRSFIRLENALAQLVEAAALNRFICTPQ